MKRYLKHARDTDPDRDRDPGPRRPPVGVGTPQDRAEPPRHADPREDGARGERARARARRDRARRDRGADGVLDSNLDHQRRGGRALGRSDWAPDTVRDHGGPHRRDERKGLRAGLDDVDVKDRRRWLWGHESDDAALRARGEPRGHAPCGPQSCSPWAPPSPQPSGPLQASVLPPRP